MELLFVRPDNGVGNTVLSKLRAMVRRSGGPVRAAVAWLTHPEIIDDFIARRDRGDVTLLLLNSNDFIRPAGSDASKLVISKHLLRLVESADPRFGSLQIRTLGQRSVSYSVMHHKFIIDDESVAFGTVNWTRSAVSANFECFAVSRDPAIRLAFAAEFDGLWDQAQDMYVKEGQVRRILCPVCGTADGVDFESWGPFCIRCQHEFHVSG